MDWILLFAIILCAICVGVVLYDYYWNTQPGPEKKTGGHAKSKQKRILTTKRLFLRTFTERDIPRMAELFAKPANMENIGSGKTLDYEQSKAKIMEHINDNYTIYAIVLKNKKSVIIGMMGDYDGKWVNRKHWEGMKLIKIMIDENYRRRGYAKEILCGYIEAFPAKYYYYVNKNNVGSISLAKSCGFRETNSKKIAETNQNPNNTMLVRRAN